METRITSIEPGRLYRISQLADFTRTHRRAWDLAIRKQRLAIVRIDGWARVWGYEALRFLEGRKLEVPDREVAIRERVAEQVRREQALDRGAA